MIYLQHFYAYWKGQADDYCCCGVLYQIKIPILFPLYKNTDLECRRYLGLDASNEYKYVVTCRKNLQ
jgi:hypothetical protein